MPGFWTRLFSSKTTLARLEKKSDKVDSILPLVNGVQGPKFQSLKQFFFPKSFVETSSATIAMPPVTHRATRKIVICVDVFFFSLFQVVFCLRCIDFFKLPKSIYTKAKGYAKAGKKGEGVVCFGCRNKVMYGSFKNVELLPNYLKKPRLKSLVYRSKQPVNQFQPIRVFPSPPRLFSEYDYCFACYSGRKKRKDTNHCTICRELYCKKCVAMYPFPASFDLMNTSDVGSGTVEGKICLSCRFHLLSDPPGYYLCPLDTYAQYLDELEGKSDSERSERRSRRSSRTSNASKKLKKRRSSKTLKRNNSVLKASAIDLKSMNNRAALQMNRSATMAFGIGKNAIPEDSIAMHGLLNRTTDPVPSRAVKPKPIFSKLVVDEMEDPLNITHHVEEKESSDGSIDGVVIANVTTIAGAKRISITSRSRRSEHSQSIQSKPPGIEMAPEFDPDLHTEYDELPPPPEGLHDEEHELPPPPSEELPAPGPKEALPNAPIVAEVSPMPNLAITPIHVLQHEEKQASHHHNVSTASLADMKSALQRLKSSSSLRAQSIRQPNYTNPHNHVIRSRTASVIDYAASAYGGEEVYQDSEIGDESLDMVSLTPGEISFDMILEKKKKRALKLKKRRKANVKRRLRRATVISKRGPKKSVPSLGKLKNSGMSQSFSTPTRRRAATKLVVKKRVKR